MSRRRKLQRDIAELTQRMAELPPSVVRYPDGTVTITGWGDVTVEDFLEPSVAYEINLVRRGMNYYAHCAPRNRPPVESGANDA